MKRIVRWRPSRKAVSAAIVIAFVAGIGVLAATNRGFAVTDVQLDDSGVWVTKTSDHLIGRLNHQAGSIDGALRSDSTEYDVVQSGKNVLSRDTRANSVAVIDPVALAESGKATLPASAQIGLGASTFAVLDTAKGLAWVMPVTAVAGFSAEAVSAAAKDLAGGVLAVTTGGDVLIASAAKGTLTRIETDGEGTVRGTSTQKLKGVEVKDDLAITAVGSEAVIADRTQNLIILPGQKSAAAINAKDLQLQQPGPAATSVIYATTSALVTQPLDGSGATSVNAGADGKPAQPVALAGCGYGVWNGTGKFVRDCAGTTSDSVQTVQGATSALLFRVNWGLVVLNDAAGGGVWLTDDKLIKVDDWQQALPSKNDGQQDSDTPEQTLQEQLPDRSEQNRPPIAVDDDFGVRAGRVTLLPVAANDSDPDGDVLTVSLQGPSPSTGEVTSVQTGSALQISVPAGQTGSSSFQYVADDGRGGKASATVRLKVVPEAENTAPKQTREAVVRVAQGKHVDYNLLSDWLDPDGDPLYLADAASTADGDEVRFRADGTISFQDSGKASGRKRVRVRVSDGRAETEGTISFDVRAAGTMAPVVNPDHYAVAAGESLTGKPLANDSDPQGGELRLVKVDELNGAEVVPDYRSGTFSFTTESTGTFYLTYAAANDAGSTAGLVRIDVLPKAEGDLAPVAVADTAVLPAGGSVLSGVLANDEDPKGGVLIVQSIEMGQDAPISVAILNHELLRISEVRAFDKPYEFSYTISNGSRTADGTVTVIPAPAPAQLQPPDAVDDEATVRAGDIVTIPVLKNDTHPDNVPLSLVPQLVETPPAEAGSIFTSQDTVRFHAGTKPGTYNAVYQVTDGQNVDAAKIAIRVTAPDPEHNTAPVPQRLTARAIAGTEVRISVPLDGIDPEGDSAYLVGQASAPAKGIVKETGTNYLLYQANEDASGTDAFTYAVRDRLGATGTATVIVGIAQPSKMNRPPTPTDDLVKVRPGRMLAVPVLVNDTDPDGDPLHVEADSVHSDDGIAVEVKNDRLVFRAPQPEGTYTITYRAADPFGASAAATVTVEVSTSEPLQAPIARDDEVPQSDVAGKKSVKVSVLDNDEDPDGAVSELKVSAEAGATVNSDNTVTIPVTEDTQIVPYTVTDPDKLTGQAFIIVPGTGQITPMLSAGAAKLSVKSGQPLPIQLADVITVAPGKKARITTEKFVTANRGTAQADGDAKVTFTSDKEYAGQAGVTLEVTDGANAEDPAGHKVMLTIPITVLAPDNRPPVFTSGQISVAAGESQVVDLTRYARDPDAADQGKLTFAITGQPAGRLGAALSGASLKITAPADAVKGTSGEVKLTVKDPTHEPVPGSIIALVVGSTKPLPRAVDDVVADARGGRTETVSVLANDYNPFPAKPLTLISAAVETGTGTAAVQGQQVSITPGTSFTGTLVVRYRIGDATGDPARQVEGRVRLNVKGLPGPPLGVTVNEVGDGKVVLSWSAAAANGSPITGYTVSSYGGYTRQCPATTCTLTGLSNGTAYTFVVVAHNEVGDSPPSASSAEATPDAVPATPQAPTLAFGDQYLDVAWSTPASRGTPVSTFDLRIQPAPPSGADVKRGVTGTSLRWEGLKNGVSYRVAVKAYNDLPGGSEWSAFSGSMVPAGPPPAPSRPSVEVRGVKAVVSWKALGKANGDKPSAYIVYGSGAASGVTMKTSGSATSVTVSTPVSTDDYTFAVAAVNKAGEGERSALSDPVRVVGKLGAIGNVDVQVADGSARLSFGEVSGEGLRSGEIEYYAKVSGQGKQGCGSSPSCDVSGLSNGKTYTITLIAQAQVNGRTISSSKDVSGIRPYGPIHELSSSRLEWSSDGPDGTFTWPTDFSFLQNGREITKVTVSVDGHSTANDGSERISNDPNSSHTLDIEVCAGDSGCTQASISGDTGENPPPPDTTGDDEPYQPEEPEQTSQPVNPEPTQTVPAGGIDIQLSQDPAGADPAFQVGVTGLPDGSYPFTCSVTSNGTTRQETGKLKSAGGTYLQAIGGNCTGQVGDTVRFDVTGPGGIVYTTGDLTSWN